MKLMKMKKNLKKKMIINLPRKVSKKNDSRIKLTHKNNYNRHIENNI